MEFLYITFLAKTYAYSFKIIHAILYSHIRMSNLLDAALSFAGIPLQISQFSLLASTIGLLIYKYGFLFYVWKRLETNY
jgi:hypothetical protein